MGKFADWLKKVFANPERAARKTSHSGKIKIIHRSDDNTQSARTLNVGRIIIRRINQNPSSAASAASLEVPVENPNLGRGIMIERRRKPKTCPLCRSSGTIVENPDGRPRWKCSSCQNRFD